MVVRRHTSVVLPELIPSIKRKTWLKLLGVTLKDNRRNWDLHYEEMLKKASGRMYIMKVCKYYGLSIKQLDLLFDSLIMSIFTFAIELWGCAYDGKYLNQIDKLIKRAHKNGYISKRTHIKEIRDKREKKLWNKITSTEDNALLELLPEKRRRYFDFNMSSDNHKTELTTLVNELMTDIDSKPLHPRNELLVYSRYVLSKISWHFTIAILSKTWVIENIDPVVNQYIRKWLEIPIPGTLSTVFLTRNKSGQSIYPPSVKFIQCQTVLLKALKLSPNQSINELWKSTNTHTNIQYDFYNSTKEVLKDFRSEHEDKLQNQLTCQGSFFSSITKSSLSHLSKVWSTAQSKLPQNIYNLNIRYINNSLPSRKNFSRWGLSSSSECSFCLGPGSLLQVVTGCQCYLDRFTWRHNSILNFLANTLQSVNGSALYAEVPGFKSPSIITGDTYRPDLLLSLSNGSLYVVELTVGYETNLENNVNRKKAKYKELVKQLDENFNEVNFINLSMSSLGIFAQECSTFLEMLKNVGLDKNYQTYCVRKMMTIAIRSTHYIFCRRNKEWESPDLLTI
ncbi:Hypothetical predicted protein [Paramuricea clavata]|uniref:Uncharacterized protein n=1 Tax=Paramuricea clavata TaxID=317549 RepID=A0A6S7JW12_PARCT|nr:Hypothetical predicted protein [Paramuricea clavata]